MLLYKNIPIGALGKVPFWRVQKLIEEWKADVEKQQEEKEKQEKEYEQQRRSMTKASTPEMPKFEMPS